MLQGRMSTIAGACGRRAARGALATRYGFPRKARATWRYAALRQVENAEMAYQYLLLLPRYSP